MFLKKNVLGWLVISTYLSFVIAAQNMINIDREQPVVVLLLIVVLCFLFTPVLMKLCNRIELKRAFHKTDSSSLKKIFMISFLICLFIQGIWLAGYYPGSTRGDHMSQLTQFMIGEISDHHPALHTILALGIPYYLVHHFAAIVIIQDIFFSLAFAYATVTMYEYGCPKRFLITIMALLLANPYSSVMLLYPLKDTTFAILTLYAITMYAKIYFTEGQWLQRKSNIFVFIVMLTLATIMRHNAILYTAPLLFSLFYYARVNWKKILIIVGSVFLCLTFIRNPLYNFWKIQKTTKEQNIAELYGLPMTILGNVLVQKPESLDAETRAFLYRIASQEQWEATYAVGSWNSMKWSYGRGNDVLEAESADNLAKYFWDGITVAPKESLYAVLELTNIVWSIDGKLDWYFLPQYGENEFTDNVGGISSLQTLLRYWWEISRIGILKYLFWYLGIINLLLVCISFSKGIKTLGLSLPILCYNFGTMLLLCGNDVRFFFFSYLVFPMTLFMLLSPREKNDMEGGIE